MNYTIDIREQWAMQRMAAYQHPTFNARRPLPFSERINHILETPSTEQRLEACSTVAKLIDHIGRQWSG